MIPDYIIAYSRRNRRRSHRPWIRNLADLLAIFTVAWLCGFAACWILLTLCR